MDGDEGTPLLQLMTEKKGGEKVWETGTVL